MSKNMRFPQEKWFALETTAIFHNKKDTLPAQAFPQILKKVPEGLQTAGLEQRRFGGQVEKNKCTGDKT